MVLDEETLVESTASIPPFYLLLAYAGTRRLATSGVFGGWTTMVQRSNEAIKLPFPYLSFLFVWTDRKIKARMLARRSQDLRRVLVGERGEKRLQK
jgi:hypothetical protein